METTRHSMDQLFIQLGLPDAATEIDAFVASHRLPTSTAIADAPFWTPTQSVFLRQSLLDDADWAVVVDALAARLEVSEPG